MPTETQLQNILSLRQEIAQGSEARLKQQRDAGKLTAHERVEQLLDACSFVETGSLVSTEREGAGVVTGYGTMEDRPVYVFAQDFTVKGGAMGTLQAKKITRLLDTAAKCGAPVVALLDCAGVRVDEGARAMGAYSEIANKLARMSGVCPTVAIVCGPCMGSAATLAQLCDVCIVVDGITNMSVFGPQVMAAMNGLQVDAQKSGGAKLAMTSGSAALLAANEAEGFALCRKLLSLLPSCNLEDTAIIDTDDMNRAVNTDGDMKALIAEMADRGTLLELYAGYEPSIATYLCRFGGHSAAFVAAQGKLTAGALKKAARFVRFADCYQLPVVSVLDTCGVFVDSIDAQADLFKAQAQLMFAYAEATAPKLALVTGSAVGQGYVAMGGTANADVTYAWPGSVISALTPEAAVAVLYGDEVKQSAGTAEEARQACADRFITEVAGAANAAADGMLDDIIAPSASRQMLIAALEMMASKRDSGLAKKHDNLPL